MGWVCWLIMATAFLQDWHVSRDLAGAVRKTEHTFYVHSVFGKDSFVRLPFEWCSASERFLQGKKYKSDHLEGAKLYSTSEFHLRKTEVLSSFGKNQCLSRDEQKSLFLVAEISGQKSISCTDIDCIKVKVIVCLPQETRKGMHRSFVVRKTKLRTPSSSLKLFLYKIVKQT